MEVIDDDDGDFVAEGLADAADDFGVGLGIAFGDHGAVTKEEDAVVLGGLAESRTVPRVWGPATRVG